MAEESAAVLTVKFQVRMTPAERKALEEITQQQWPGSSHLQSLMIRRLIMERLAEQQKQQVEQLH